MSLMNALSVTLVVLILGAIVALFFGTRSSDAFGTASPLAVPVHLAPQSGPEAASDRSSGSDNPNFE